MASLKLSVVVPLYNEEESVVRLYEAISNAVKPMALPYEIIFVDDGSRDDTYNIVKTITDQDPCLSIIKFRRNYGQTPAMAAGIDHAKGEFVVTMDGDLQNDPSDIPMMIEKIHEGYDIVVGWRHNRQDKLITRKIPSKIANWLIGKVTGVPIKDNGCSLKVYRRTVIQSVPLYSEMHRFIPAMMSLAGSRVAEVKVKHHARQFGTSKYGLSRIYKVLFDLLGIKTIISFSSRPLLWFAILSIPFIIASAIFLGLFVVNMFDSTIKDSMVFIGSSVIFAITAMFMFFCGALGELIFKTGDVKLHKLSQLTIQTHGSKK